MDDLIVIPIIGMIFIGLPWVILHYITRWKTSASLTSEDEHLLEELYVMARRLDERMNTIERIVAADNPGFRPSRNAIEAAEESLSRVDRFIAERERTKG